MIRAGGRIGLVSAGALLSALSVTAVGAQAAGAAPRTSHTAVHIVVPPVDVILVNRSGRPVAVETNTNRSPRRGDMFFTTDSPQNQQLNKATRAQSTQILRAVSTVAVWEPGWHYLGRR